MANVQRVHELMRTHTKDELLKMAFAGGLVDYNNPRGWRKDEIAAVVAEQEERGTTVDHAPEDDYDDEQDDAPEWQQGECDMCAGDAGEMERAAQVASAIVPVCACAIGQGAPADECLCGPELFAGRTPEATTA